MNFCFSFRNVAMGTSTACARVSGFLSAYAPLLVSKASILIVKSYRVKNGYVN